MKRRHGALVFAGLAAAVAALHGWVIERVARQAPAVAGAAAPPKPQAAVMLASLRIDSVAPLEPTVPAAGAGPEHAPEPAVKGFIKTRAVARGAAPAGNPAPEARAAMFVPSAAATATAPMAAPDAQPAPAAAEAPVEPAASATLLLAATAAAAAATPTLPANPPPTYRTRVPAAAQVSYRLSRGALAGSGELDWRPEGAAYTLRLEGRLPIVGTLITQTSRGGFDAAGLAPERYTDKRLRRGEQAANFQRSSGRISFSGQNPELPLSPGVQDRLSVMLQLAAIVNAWARPPATGEQLRIEVVGARGDLHLWSLRFEGSQAVETPDGRVPALRFLREPENPHDTRAEFWLDPARQHLPVKVVLTDGKGEPLELLRVK